MKYRINFNLFLFFLLIGIIIFSLFYGAVRVPISDVVKILLNKTGLFNLEITKKSYVPIVFFVRFPRIMVAVIVGGALALCGCTMQSLLKNPIVDSGITDNLLLILSGIAIGSFVGAITSVILTSLAETEMKEYIFWAMGSLNGRRWEHFLFGLIPIAILSPILFYYGKELNILLLGDEEAKSLGINIKKIRAKILIIIALLTAISVCISGNITFVGLIVPHILRKIIGSDNRKLLKSSFLAGACFLTFSDLLSRIVLAPKEISVGIVTALIGAPYFIYLIVKIRREGKTL